MAEISKQALKVENNTSFPNNNTGAITPADLRAFNVDMIDSLVDELGYNQDSASWNSSIDALEAFTSSQQPAFTALNQFTASQLTINTGVNAFTQSADVRLDALESETLNLELFTASVNQIADNGIVQGTSTRLHFYGLVSASIVPNVNGAIASINIEQDGTKLNSSSFNSYTASTNSDLDSIHQTTQSLNNFTASLTTAFVGTASFNAYTQSINSYTSSNDAKVNSLINATASYATSAITASSLITASVNLNTITFTKGDASTFNITVNTGSGGGGTTDITSLNAFTASQDTKNTTLANVTSSLNASTASQQSQINSLIAATGSYVTSTITASSLVTASFSGNTLTFTKGDSSTFGVVIPDVSGSTINTGSFVTTSSFNAYTSSNDNKVNSLINATGSYAISSSVAAVDAGQQSQIDALIAATGSYSTSSNDITSLNAFTASQETKDTTLASVTSSLNSATASLFTSASLGLVTASFAGNTLTFTKGDTTTFGVVIPDISGSAGTTIFEVVYTGESITKGDPLYISGSQGANPIVFKADASNPAKMPVTFISNETIGAANTTNAIVLGLIEGIDLTGYVAGQSIYVAEGTGGYSINLPSGSNSVTQLLGVITKGGSGGKGLVLNPGPAQLPGLDTGKMWVGGSTNQPIEITTASFVSSTSFNQYTQSNDSKVDSLINATASYVTSAITASSLVTASVNLNTITFTKGDASTFNITVNTGSGGSTINTGSFATTGSNIFVADQIITGSAGFLYSNGTGTKLRLGTSENLQNFDFRVTGSGLEQQLWLIENQGGVWGNSFFNRMYVDSNLNVNSTFTASLQEGYVWVGNSSGKTSTVATSSFGGGLPSGLLSSSVTNFVDYSQSVDTRINNIVTGTGFATTGSNTFTGDQNILGTLTASLQEGYVWAGGVGNISTLVATSSFAGGGGTISVQDEGTILGNATSFDFNGAGVTATLSAGTASITIPGGGGSIDTGSFATTGSNTFTGDQTLIDNSGNFFTITDASGSMMLVAKGFTSASLHLSASAAGIGNFIFKTNSNTPDTIISGSGNIFVNGAAPTAGFKRYIGGSNNIYNTTGLPQISSSMAFPVVMSGNVGPGSYTFRGPVSSSAWSIGNNYNAGTIQLGIGALNRAERIVSGFTATGNLIQGNLNVVAQNDNLTSSVNFSNNSMAGTVTLNLSSSAAVIQNNIINDSNFTLTNQYYTASLGRGQITVSRNTIGGQNNTILVTGIGDAGVSTQPQFNNNTIGGQNNTIFSNSTGAGSNQAAIANIIFGNTLIVTGSSSGTTSTYGSAFFGRFNADDGIRNKTSDVIFSVGTGTNSTTGRKTGFLIDTGSNSFFEGAVSISGSLLVNGAGVSTVGFATTGSNSFNGNQTITGSLTMSGSMIFVDRSGNDTNVYLGLNALGLGLAGASPLALGNTNSIAIGAGAMRFASGSNQNVAIGYDTLQFASGVENVAIASNTLTENTTGGQNVAIGIGALNKNTTGIRNVAIGGGALFNNIAGAESNVAIGRNAGNGTSGSFNTFIGDNAGQNVSGSRNVILGRYQGSSGETFSNNIIIADGNGTIEARFDGDWQFYDNVNVTGSINVVSGSLTGQAVTNITPVSSSLLPVLNMVTLTTAEYALITPNSQTLYIIV
jgi:hypothetical protein